MTRAQKLFVWAAALLVIAGLFVEALPIAAVAFLFIGLYFAVWALMVERAHG